MRHPNSLPEDLNDPKSRALLRPVPPPDPKAPAPVMASLGLELDEDPYPGLIGVAAMRALAEGLEEHHVSRARHAGWSWAEIAAVLDVSAQAAHKKHAKRLGDRHDR
jgi:hypothetical protein